MKATTFSSTQREVRYETPRMSGPYEVRRSIMTGSTEMTLPEIVEFELDWD